MMDGVGGVGPAVDQNDPQGEQDGDEQGRTGDELLQKGGEGDGHKKGLLWRVVGIGFPSFWGGKPAVEMAPSI